MSVVAQYLPLGALAAVLVAVVLTLHHAVARAGARGHPVLLSALALSALLPLYVCLVWARVVPESYLRLAHPWSTLAGFAAMAFVTVRLSRQRRQQSTSRKHGSDLFLALALMAAALAAAGPELGRPLDRLSVVVIVDRSRSIDLVPHAETRVARELGAAEPTMRPGDTLGTVVFANDAASEELPRPKDGPRSDQRVTVARDGTDIAAGIKRALADVPPDSAARLVLVSDGVPTRGDALAAAAAAVASDIPIDTLVLEQREVSDVRVVAFRAPAHAAEKEKMDLGVVVSSPASTRVQVRIREDGVPIDAFEAEVKKGEQVLHRDIRAESPGLHRYDVEITALDKRLDENAEDNAATAFVRVRGPARALVVDGYGADKTRFVASALESAGFLVKRGTASAVPADVGALAGFDLVVMGDVPASDLDPEQIDLLAAYVRDLGGGLLLLGGDRSFGPGGYSRTPLEEVSPVAFDLKQEQRRASLAEVIAIDISGSMAMQVKGRTKLELANEAAARSAALLGPGDYLGVEHVDTSPRWSVPLGPVTDPKAIEAAIRGVGPGGGGIYVDVALDEAFRALAKVSVNLKHVLVFADGDDAERITPAVEAQTRAARAAGITTSTVALGKGVHVAALEQLSRLGGGRYYIVEDATRLPAVFAQETILASRSALVEEPFRARRVSSLPVLLGVDVEAAPALGGYVVTMAKPRSDVLLAGPEGDPLLASWQAGLGHAAVFTSDLKDRWGEAWTRWEGAAKLVIQLARQLARRQDDARVRLEASVSAGQLHLRATALDDDGRLQSFRRLHARVQGPGGFSREVPLDAAGPGTYQSTVTITQPGAYIAVVRGETDGVLATAGTALGRGEELRPTGSDRGLLARISELSGGKLRDTLAGIFTERLARRFAYEDVTVPLLFVAAFALLLAVAARRLALGEPLRALGQKLAEMAAPRTREPEVPADKAQAADTLAALISQKKGRGEEETQPPAPAGAPPIAAPLPPAVRRPLPPTAPPAPTPGKAATPDAPPESSAPKTAAEILLERRRGKRR